MAAVGTQCFVVSEPVQLRLELGLDVAQFYLQLLKLLGLPVTFVLHPGDDGFVILELLLQHDDSSILLFKT